MLGLNLLWTGLVLVMYFAWQFFFLSLCLFFLIKYKQYRKFAFDRSIVIDQGSVWVENAPKVPYDLPSQKKKKMLMIRYPFQSYQVHNTAN